MYTRLAYTQAMYTKLACTLTELACQVAISTHHTIRIIMANRDGTTKSSVPTSHFLPHTTKAGMTPPRSLADQTQVFCIKGIRGRIPLDSILRAYL